MSILATVLLALMLLKVRKIVRMNRSYPEGRQTIGVYSSLWIALGVYAILYVAGQATAWYAWSVDWWGVWLLMMVPLIVPLSFVFLLRSTRDDYSVENPAVRYPTAAQASPKNTSQPPMHYSNPHPSASGLDPQRPRGTSQEWGGGGGVGPGGGSGGGGGGGGVLRHPQQASPLYPQPVKRALPPQLTAVLETPGRSFVPVAPEAGNYPPPMPHYPPLRPDMEEDRGMGLG